MKTKEAYEKPKPVHCAQNKPQISICWNIVISSATNKAILTEHHFQLFPSLQFKTVPKFNDDDDGHSVQIRSKKAGSLHSNKTQKERNQ